MCEVCQPELERVGRMYVEMKAVEAAQRAEISALLAEEARLRGEIKRMREAKAKRQARRERNLRLSG